MIQNIIDRRTREYRWLSVDVVAEPMWHDNAIKDSDYAEHDHNDPSYAARTDISLAEVINWAAAMPPPMTLYIYDRDIYDRGSNAVVDDVPWPNDSLSG